MTTDLTEPSDTEKAEWQQATEAYVRWLEARIDELEANLEKEVEFVLLPQMADVTKKLKAVEAKLAKAVTIMSKEHALMRECGWHLATASDPQGDGVLEVSVCEVEEEFVATLAELKERCDE